MWIPPEVDDPVLLHHPTRKSIGYFGAVRLRDGKFLFQREATRFDAMTTWSFLRQLRQCSRRAGRQVVVITDNAKYHHAKLHAAWRVEQEPEFRLSVSVLLTASGRGRWAGADWGNVRTSGLLSKLWASTRPRAWLASRPTGAARR